LKRGLIEEANRGEFGGYKKALCFVYNALQSRKRASLFTLSLELLSLISMAVSAFKMLGFFVGFYLMVGLVSSVKFDELFQPSWAQDHLAYEGELLRLKLDSYSGK
jgi:hypothetical protein